MSVLVGRHVCRLLTLTLVLATLSVDAAAHRGHGCWTEMTWADGRFEIIHRLHLSDAIAVLNRRDPDTTIDSLRGRAQLALYLEESFSITVLGQPTTALQTVGAEIEDDFLIVYQEWTTSRPATMPQIENRALLDIEPDAEHWLRYNVNTQDFVEKRITPKKH